MNWRSTLLSASLLTLAAFAQEPSDSKYGQGSSGQEPIAQANTERGSTPANGIKAEVASSSDAGSTPVAAHPLAGDTRGLVGTPVQPPADSAAGHPSLLSSDVYLVAELTKGIDARKAKAGDRVTAVVIQDLLSHGKIAVRRGSKLTGHVVHALARTKDRVESELAFVFDEARLKGGGELSFHGIVQALAPPQRIALVDTPDQMATPALGGRLSGGGGPMGSRPGSGSMQVFSKNGASAATTAATGPGSFRTGASSNQDSISVASRGVIGITGMVLDPAGTSSGGTGPVIKSTHHDVRLDTGTQVLLQVSRQ
ncbi:MAG TPA: hypothetical protein VKZ53_09455 [Candidatus Angelobacter sp.]|nr:hypothetical protein [Candidatus Angelobacter sp.]